MDNSFTFRFTEQDLPAFAKPFAQALQKGDMVALWGGLGAGKTTFARSLIQCLVKKAIQVPSPTFTLVQIYDVPQGELWHCDLYRLESPEESFELGLEEAFHRGISLVEWPERLGNLLPTRRIDVIFTIASETAREIAVNLIGSHDAFRIAFATLCGRESSP